MSAAGPNERWTGGDVDGGDVTIHYRRTGAPDAPPLVLAHGFSDSSACWERTATALADVHDVVAFDARNHGASGTGPGEPAALVRDVVALVDRLELRRPVLMGHSLGAGTMADVVATHPGIAARLVLEDPPWSTARTEAAMAERKEGVRAFVRSLAVMTDGEIERLGRSQHPDWPDDEFPAWVDAKRGLRLEAVDALVAADWSTVVAALDCPTLLVYGEPERGGIVTAEVAGRAAAANPLVRAAHVADAGHNIRRENFAGFIGVVRAFLDRP